MNKLKGVFAHPGSLTHRTLELAAANATKKEIYRILDSVNPSQIVTPMVRSGLIEFRAVLTDKGMAVLRKANKLSSEE